MKDFEDKLQQLECLLNEIESITNQWEKVLIDRNIEKKIHEFEYEGEQVKIRYRKQFVVKWVKNSLQNEGNIKFDFWERIVEIRTIDRIIEKYKKRLSYLKTKKKALCA